MEKQGKWPRIRIVWQAEGRTSYGVWQSASRYSWMQEVVAGFNADYGPGTHWIEEEVPRRKPRMVKCLGVWRCGDYPAYGISETQEVAYAMWKKNLQENVSKKYWKKYFPDEEQ